MHQKSQVCKFCASFVILSRKDFCPKLAEINSYIYLYKLALLNKNKMFWTILKIFFISQNLQIICQHFSAYPKWIKKKTRNGIPVCTIDTRVYD